MWGFCGALTGGWWMFPLIGMILCMGFMAVIMWAMMGGRGIMSFGGHGHGSHDAQTDLQREIRELRQEVQQLRAAH